MLTIIDAIEAVLDGDRKLTREKADERLGLDVLLTTVVER